MLGKRLREAREYLQLSQDEVASALSLSRPAISLIEKGERNVQAMELQRFAELYRQPISQFLGQSDETFTQLPPNIAHLARAASELTDDDREELLRFAQFMKSRKL